MDKKVRSAKSEKRRLKRNSVTIAWTNEQKADSKWLWRHMVIKTWQRNKKEEGQQ